MAVPLKFDFEIFSAFFSRGYTVQVQTEQHRSFDKGLRLFATRFLQQEQHGSWGESTNPAQLSGLGKGKLDFLQL